MRRTAVVASVVGSLVGGALGTVASAQTRVVVPIIVQSPGLAGAKRSIQVTTQTTSPAPGGTTTRITVQDTTGRKLGVVPSSGAVPGAPGMTTTRVTVQDTTGRKFGVVPSSGAIPATPGVTTTRITVQDTTGRLLGVAPASRAMAPAAGRPSAAPSGGTSAGPSVVVGVDRPLVPFGAGPGAGRRTWTITSDGPIDLPVVFLAD